MNPTHDAKSIRTSLFILLIGGLFIFIAVSLFWLGNISFDQKNKLAQQEVIYWADYIAQLSSNDLINSNNEQLNKKLLAFKSVKMMQLIDVYKYYPNKTKELNLVMFASFHYQLKNNENQAEQAKRLNENKIGLLATPINIGNTVEYIAPIEHQNSIIGYLHIKTENINSLVGDDKTILYFVIFCFLLLGSLTLIIFKLEKIITEPIDEINQQLIAVSQQKNYNTQLANMPYKEVDILARNVNNLLNRTQRHIDKLSLAEQRSLKLNSELEDKVTKRTAALKQSNQDLLSTLEELHQFQDQLVESEKMASLGDMVAGVAHEVNTPIGLGVTASTLLSDRIEEIKDAFDGKTLRSSQLKRFLNEGQENVGIIYRNLHRAADLISSFKKVAVDQTSDDVRKVNMSELLHEVLFTLAPQIKSTPYNIAIDCPNELIVVSKPGPINQILINLVLNSIIHGFEKRDFGTIHIHVMKLGEQLNILYHDDGHGIDDCIKHKIFEPFTTTKRGEGGSGLGLHLVYNLVTQALGGNISLIDTSDAGAKFEINFPINEYSI
jgi:signal transduction histidine kinase